MGTKLSAKVAAASTDLGDLICPYRSKSFTAMLTIGAGLLLMGLLAPVLGLTFSVEQFPLEAWKKILSFVVLVVGGGGVVWTGISLLTRSQYFLFDGGFVLADGKNVQAYAWDDIAWVQLTEIAHKDRYGNTVSYSHTFLVHASDGREVMLDDQVISDGEDLGRTIMREHRLSQLKELLKLALSLEATGELAPALTAFEQLLKESPYNEIAAQAREHIERLRQRVPATNPTNDTFKH